MFYLASTRFTDETYFENKRYRENKGYPVIYGLLIKIRDIYPVGALIFVIEMNNTRNMIEGIGLIRNNLVCDKRYKIYDNNDYNRYIYKGQYWLSREQLLEYDSYIVSVLDTILFKGKSNVKRRTGITMITEKLFIYWRCELSTLKTKISNAFIYYFKDSKIIN